MKIAILHYHLKPGGVTRIIEMQLAALTARKEITGIQVFSGSPDSSIKIPPNVEFIYNPCLNYLNCMELGAKEIDIEYNRLIEFLMDSVSADTIIHAHNMNLGKNPILTAALNTLLKTGRRLVNHIHDFAEDRPANINALTHLIEEHFGRSLRDMLYPVRENCHYAVLNSFYVKRLTRLLIPKNRISLLPNPVAVEKLIADDKVRKAKEKVQKLLAVNSALPNYVYPVRGIRRKNLGEFILLAALFSDRANWITTLPPQNPVEQVEYDKWKEFCAKERIPLIFEAGQICTFKEVMAAADRCVTTSRREGFGMVFLESWLFGVPTVGRDLPVSKDFRKAGVKFAGLYQHLTLNNNEHQGTDFSRLGQEHQMAQIREFLHNPDSARAFISENPQLKKLFKNFSPEFIAANRELIQKQYSVESYGKELLDIYKTFI